MVRELGCAAAVALCTLSACSEEEAPTPEPASAPAPTAVESSSAQTPPPTEEPPEPPTSAAVAPPSRPAPRQVAAAPGPRALSGASDSAKPKGETGAWEDEVAPPGSEVGKKPKQLLEGDPWDSPKGEGTQSNAK